MKRAILSQPKRSLQFSALMTLSGALLGPFLDAYHSNFGVLQYDASISSILWGTAEHPALVTAWWVPELFGLAGFLIGWLYILGDAAWTPRNDPKLQPSVTKICLGISLFTLQYWLSGILYETGVMGREGLLNVLSAMAAVGFLALDGTSVGLAVSAATAVGGPLIEVGLLLAAKMGMIQGYHYTDLGETGFFPLWIAPVYFLGGPANGNLARGYWRLLTDKESEERQKPGCTSCNDTRRVPCPNCDGKSDYIAVGGQRIRCTSCRGSGFVICRDCFFEYDEDPSDIEAIRDVMLRFPD